MWLSVLLLFDNLLRLSKSCGIVDSLPSSRPQFRIAFAIQLRFNVPLEQGSSFSCEKLEITRATVHLTLLAICQVVLR